MCGSSEDRYRQLSLSRNGLLSLGLLAAPASALRALRSRFIAAPRAALLLALALWGLIRLGALLLRPLIAG